MNVLELDHCNRIWLHINNIYEVWYWPHLGAVSGGVASHNGTNRDIVHNTNHVLGVLFTCQYASIYLYPLLFHKFQIPKAHHPNEKKTKRITSNFSSLQTGYHNNSTTMRVEWDALSWLIRGTWGCSLFRRCTVNRGWGIVLALLSRGG
jgi:hypothetical protein